jgi:hypothetical protein
MRRQLSLDAEKVLSLAQREARQLGHEYVGTEHVLLSLLIERPATTASLGVGADVVRAEIERLVTRGPAPEAESVELPLTPRAKRVVAHAHVEATSHGQKLVEPEHLLVGLIKEPDGVAGRVMRALGLNLAEVRRESLKLRLAQMRIVERAVRPVRASSKCKRKMREELLAHLAGIFEEELPRHATAQAALAEASRRFGDPAQLARELESSLPAAERRTYFFEYWFCWRPPESVFRMMLRASILTCCLTLALACVPLLVLIAVRGWKPEVDVVAWRSVGAVAVVFPAAHFLIGVCFYKVRDALFGVFGSKMSVTNALFRATLLALCVAASSVALIAIMNGGWGAVCELAPQLGASSAFASAFCLLLAYVRGPAEIRDTIWSCLDLSATE